MWFGKSPKQQAIEAPHDYGVPKDISQLSVEPANNRPTGSDPFLRWLIDDHFRAQATFIAQLRDRVKILEEQVHASKKIT